MIFERALIHSLYSPYSIYFRMVASADSCSTWTPKNIRKQWTPYCLYSLCWEIGPYFGILGHYFGILGHCFGLLGHYFGILGHCFGILRHSFGHLWRTLWGCDRSQGWDASPSHGPLATRSTRPGPNRRRLESFGKLGDPLKGTYSRLLKVGIWIWDELGWLFLLL